MGSTSSLYAAIDLGSNSFHMLVVREVAGSIQTLTRIKRKVRLVRERDGLVVRETWSDANTGQYEFRYIDELQTWTVIAYDYEQNFRAVIADGITPEIIP